MKNKYTILDYTNYGEDTIPEVFDTHKEAKEFFLNVGIERILSKADGGAPVDEEYLAWIKERCTKNIHCTHAYHIGKIVTVKRKKEVLDKVR